MSSMLGQWVRQVGEAVGLLGIPIVSSFVLRFLPGAFGHG